MSNTSNKKLNEFLDSVNKEEDYNELTEYIDAKITEMNKVKEAIDAAVVELNKAKQAYDESKVAFTNVAKRTNNAATSINQAIEDASVAKLTVEFKKEDFDAIDTKLKNHMTAVSTALSTKYQEILTELNNKAEADVKRYKESGMWLGPYVWILFMFFYLVGVGYVSWTLLSAIIK